MKIHPTVGKKIHLHLANIDVTITSAYWMNDEYNGIRVIGAPSGWHYDGTDNNGNNLSGFCLCVFDKILN